MQVQLQLYLQKYFTDVLSQYPATKLQFITWNLHNLNICLPAHPYHDKHGHSSTGDVSSSTGDVGVYNHMCN